MECESFKLMLRYKLLSARGTGRRKEHLFVIKRAEDQEGKHRRGQAPSPPPPPPPPPPRVKTLRRNRREKRGKAREKAKPGDAMGEWDSIHALAVSDFALIIKKKKERDGGDRWEECLQQEPQRRQKRTPPLDIVLAHCSLTIARQLARHIISPKTENESNMSNLFTSRLRALKYKLS